MKADGGAKLTRFWYMFVIATTKRYWWSEFVLPQLTRYLLKPRTRFVTAVLAQQQPAMSRRRFSPPGQLADNRQFDPGRSSHDEHPVPH
jgi:hypothetical protein